MTEKVIQEAAVPDLPFDWAARFVDIPLVKTPSQLNLQAACHLISSSRTRYVSVCMAEVRFPTRAQSDEGLLAE